MSWTDVLRNLADRGLRGVTPVIADDHKGLRAAARRVANATRQRCRGPWMRNAPARQHIAVAAMPETIFARKIKAEAQARRDTVADALREKQDRPGAFMDACRDDVLACRDVPREHRIRIASTNALERVNREIERRADVIGFVRKTAPHAVFVSSAFPDDGAIIRLVGAPMPQTDDAWTAARRHMSPETLARVTDRPTLTLSAVAT